MTSDCGKTRLDWMDTLALVLRQRPSFEHLWHAREQDRYPLHPAVREAVIVAAPVDWHLLVLQWPHVSIKDSSRLAYTRCERHGADDRQTVTSIPKYLAEHFPKLQSHIVRDICGKYGNHEFQVTHDLEQMLRWMADAPQSCMTRRDYQANDWHPYRCYDPRFGWGLAVRLDNGRVMARALVNENDKSFVRTFGAIENNRNHSQADNALHSWLLAQGYEYSSSWSGLRLALVRHPDGGWTAPYIDGDCQAADMRDGYLLITEHGDYSCTCTDGTLDDDDIRHCEDCDDRININDGDHTWAGRYEDRLICESCAGDYARATGANGNEYYVHTEDCTYIDSNDTWYEDRYMQQNGIVWLVDTSEHCHQDDAVYLSARDEWVSIDCPAIVFCELSGNNEHVDDCVLLDDGTYMLASEQDQRGAA